MTSKVLYQLSYVGERPTLAGLEDESHSPLAAGFVFNELEDLDAHARLVLGWLAAQPFVADEDANSKRP